MISNASEIIFIEHTSGQTDLNKLNSGRCFEHECTWNHLYQPQNVLSINLNHMSSSHSDLETCSKCTRCRLASLIEVTCGHYWEILGHFMEEKCMSSSNFSECKRLFFLCLNLFSQGGDIIFGCSNWVFYCAPLYLSPSSSLYPQTT